MDRHSKRSVLSVSGKKLRRPCLDRFAVFAKASRNLPLRSKRFAVSALDFFDATWLRRLAPDRASRGGAKRRAFLSLKAEGQSDLTF